MKFSQIALSFLLISYLLLTSCSSQAETKTQKPSASTKRSLADDWSKFPQTESQFMQGCVGQKEQQKSQKKINFCQCAFNSYKARYSPQQFGQINALANQMGANGPILVNVMMKPELDRCFAQTNYRP